MTTSTVVEVSEFFPVTGWSAPQDFDLETIPAVFDLSPYLLPAEGAHNPILTPAQQRVLTLAELVEHEGRAW